MKDTILNSFLIAATVSVILFTAIGNLASASQTATRQVDQSVQASAQPPATRMHDRRQSLGAGSERDELATRILVI